jgi:hypothetical protein
VVEGIKIELAGLLSVLSRVCETSAFFFLVAVDGSAFG